MASLFKRGDWYHLSFFDKGRAPQRKQIPLKTRSRRAAERLRRDLEDAYALGTYDPWTTGAAPEGAPEGDALYLDALGGAVTAFLATRSNLSPFTVKKYRSVLGLFQDHLGPTFAMASITPEHVKGFLDGAARRPVTKKTYSTTLSPFFNWLREREVLGANPIDRVRLERVPQKFPRFLTPEDVEALVEAITAWGTRQHAGKQAGQWLIPIVRANVYLGLRNGELVNLRWDHVDLKRRAIIVANTETFGTKSGKDRVLPLCEEAYGILLDLERRTPWVFPSHSGRQLGRGYLSHRFKEAARDAGLPDEVDFHTTRHTAASWLAQAGCGVEAIRAYMGHSSISVTQKYMHLSRESFASQIGRAFALVGK